MNHRAKLLSPSFVLLSLLFASTSCKQGDGERCEINSDCEGGLICDISVGGGSSNGVNGICRSSISAGPTTGDASVKLDTTPIWDVKVDQSGKEVVPSPDGFQSDTSPRDAVSIDGTRTVDGMSAADTLVVDGPMTPDTATTTDTAADVPLPSDTAVDLALQGDATDRRVD